MFVDLCNTCGQGCVERFSLAAGCSAIVHDVHTSLWPVLVVTKRTFEFASDFRYVRRRTGGLNPPWILKFVILLLHF